MSARQQLRHLVDTLPEPEVYAALRFIEFLKQAGRGEVVAWEDVKQRLG